MIHELKVWPEFFDALETGAKPFEVRLDDRCFAVRDTLILREWDNNQCAYTGREVRRLVTYKLDDWRFGLQPGYCVLGLAKLEPQPQSATFDQGSASCSTIRSPSAVS